jgi:ketosteroid isomerase-like protein
MVACKREAPDTRAADEQTIRNLSDVEWLKAAQAKDVERWLSYYAEDVVVMPPNEPSLVGREANRPRVSEWVANPGFAIHWQTTRLDVSRAGDMAYSLCTYELMFNDPKGKPVTDRGKLVDVWKKQPDGTWKLAVGIWNSDQPAAAVEE